MKKTVILLAIVFVITGCGHYQDVASSWTIQYEVTGNPYVQNPDFAAEQSDPYNPHLLPPQVVVGITYAVGSQVYTYVNNVTTLPWTFTFTGTVGEYVYLSAFDDDQPLSTASPGPPPVPTVTNPPGNLIVTIYENGQVLETDSSSSANATVGVTTTLAGQ